MKFFKRWQPKPAVNRHTRRDQYRGSRIDRGYGWDWEKLARRYLKAHPFCAECERRGLTEIALHVDHMIPFSHNPELRMDESNLQSLCVPCHHGWKFRMERYAAKAHKMDELRDWCLNPSKRPKHFR